MSYQAKQCAVTLRPKNYETLIEKNQKDVDAFTLIVDETSGGFEWAAEKAGFGKDDEGNWVAYGRQGMDSEARKIKVGPYVGLRANVTEGCFINEDYHGLCDIQRAFLTNGKWSPLIEGGPESEEAVDIILKTAKLN